MSAPFWQADPRVWPLIVETMAGREWAAEVVDEDLRWMQDQIRQGYLEEIPSRRRLMARWTWTERRVRDRLRLLGDSVPQRGPKKVPTRSQRGPNEVPTDNGSSETIETKGPGEAPATSQEGPNEVPTTSTGALVPENREQRTENRVHTGPPAEPVLVHPVAVLPDDWTQLAAHYAALPWARKPTDRKKGNGKALATILREAGSLADAKALIDWWATADDDRALFLRYGKAREPDPLKPGAAPQQGLETVARHADDYRDRAIAWQARGSPVERGRGSHGAGYTPRPHRPSDDEPELTW